MMMISSPFDRLRAGRRRPPFLPPVLFGLIVLIVLAVFVVLVVLLRPALGGALWHVLSPVVALRNTFSSSQVATLQAELASTSAALADRDVLYQENIDLKARLGRDAGVQTILAAILQRPPGTPYDTLLIDAGTAEGVVQDDLVSAGGSALIGKISEVYAHQSRVTLFSAPGEGHQALLRGSIPLSVEGQGGGSMRAEAPAGTVAAVGDQVLFPGIGGGITAQLSAVDKKEGDSFVIIYLHLPTSIFQLHYVEVWKSGK